MKTLEKIETEVGARNQTLQREALVSDLVVMIMAQIQALRAHHARLSTSKDVRTRSPLRLWIIEDQLVGLEAELAALTGETNVA